MGRIVIGIVIGFALAYIAGKLIAKGAILGAAATGK